MYFTYIIRCKNGNLYTGYTVDINRRIEEHKIGKNCKYTRNYGFKNLEICFELKSKSDAMKLEYYIKKLIKSRKEFIIKNPELLIDEIKEKKNLEIKVYKIENM